MSTIIKKLSKHGIIPVVKLDNAKDALPLAQALCDGGLPCIEITFRTAAAADAIKQISRAFPDMLIGAGTVLTIEQVNAAIDAGASFIVSPGLNPKVVEYCTQNDIPVLPGCATPSDIERAIELGLNVVKFFPAETNGGLEAIKAVSAPYPAMKFIPTGGINLHNLSAYLNNPKILACGGSWMVKDSMIKAGEFDAIRKLTREAVNKMLDFKVAHVGINARDEAEAVTASGFFALAFQMPVKAGNSSVFVDSSIEIMKKPYLGTHGHLAVSTASIDRALFYLEAAGYEFDYTTAKKSGDSITSIYMKQQVCGFAIHLMQKQEAL